MKTSTIHGAARFATRATNRYPAAATQAMTLPINKTATIQAREFGTRSLSPGIGNPNQTPKAVADTVTIEPARKQKATPLTAL